MYQLSRQQSQLLVGMLAIAVLLLSGPSWATAQGAFAHGTVVALLGTPHLWIADAQGTLHWAGDTRALAGRYINWSNRLELPLDQIQRAPRGDPWLTAGLLKDGDPIYLVKWETHEPLPRLLHIQSIRDVELFGINESNYGRMVLDRWQWEARYGIPVSDLERMNLAPATALVPRPTLTAIPANADMTEQDWPPVPQEQLRFPIPGGWSYSSHLWPLIGKIPYTESQLIPPGTGRRVVSREFPFGLLDFALPETAFVATLKGRGDILSILAVLEKDYEGLTATQLRDRLADAAKAKIRSNISRLAYSFRPNTTDELIEFETQRGITHTANDLSVSRIAFDGRFIIGFWGAYLSPILRYVEYQHSFAYMEYRVIKHDNVFWIFEHSRLVRPEDSEDGEEDFRDGQERVDAIINNLEFHY